MVKLVEYFSYTLQYPLRSTYRGDDWDGDTVFDYELEDDDLEQFIDDEFSLDDKRRYAKEIYQNMTAKERREIEDYDYHYEDIDKYDEIDLDEGFGVIEYIKKLIVDGQFDDQLEKYFKDVAYDSYYSW